MSVARVLVVDDDREVREAICQTLELDGLEPVPASAFVVARDHIGPEFGGVVLTDIRMPGRDGFHLLDHARRIDPELPVILLTGEGDIPMAVRAMERGAFGFLEKPCPPDELVAILKRALEHRGHVLAERETRRAEQSGDAAARVIHGRSAQAATLREAVRRVAARGGAALIEGAPGSGTAKIAEVIHLLSAGASAPFLKQSAAGLSPDGLERMVAQAAGGTVYLDDLAALGAPAQFALREALGTEPPARLLIGCAAPLGRIEGLDAELAVLLARDVIRVPSLAERPEDIPVLFRRYVDQTCEQAGLPRRPVPADLEARLMARDWPGNAAALMSEAMRFALGGSGEPQAEEPGLAQRMAEFERSLLEDALRRAGGRARAAAERLGLPRKTFYDKLARHEIRPEDFRES